MNEERIKYLTLDEFKIEYVNYLRKNSLDAKKTYKQYHGGQNIKPNKIVAKDKPVTDSKEGSGEE